MLNPSFGLEVQKHIYEGSGLSITWSAWESIWTPLKRPLMESFAQIKDNTSIAIQNNVNI